VAGTGELGLKWKGPVPVIEHKPLRLGHFGVAFMTEGEESAGATTGDYQRESEEKDREAKAENLKC
jgi:hypothetical protein